MGYDPLLTTLPVLRRAPQYGIGIGYRYRTPRFFENYPMRFLGNQGNLVTAQVTVLSFEEVRVSFVFVLPISVNFLVT